jgi:hypothetical protein
MQAYLDENLSKGWIENTNAGGGQWGRQLGTQIVNRLWIGFLYREGPTTPYCLVVSVLAFIQLIRGHINVDVRESLSLLRVNRVGRMR